MFVLPKKVFLWLCCFALMATSVKATCERDENGNIIEKTESEGFGMGMLRRVGCKIEKGVEDLGEKAKSFGGEVKEAFKSGMKTLAKPFQSDNDEIKQQQTDPNQQNQPDTGTTLIEPMIDVRTKDVFKTDNDYLTPLTTEKTNNPESLDDRFLLNSPKICPEGQRKDAHNNCRDV